jgi:type VI secretion system protein ImpF
MSMRSLREGVLRDLAWLLNTTNLLSVTDAPAPAAPGQFGAQLRHARHVRRLAGRHEHGRPRTGDPPGDLGLRAAPDPLLGAGQGHAGAGSITKITFEIEADMWAQPYPERLYIKTELDLDQAHISLSESGGQAAMTNPRLLRYYSQELQHLREVGGEFAASTRRSRAGSASKASTAPTPTSSACWKAFPSWPRACR